MRNKLLAALALLLPLQASAASAVLGGGCFWCLESDFDKLPGVTDAVSGYSGGDEERPTYESVSDHRTGHVEVVRVSWDAGKLSYDQVLDWYWRHVDPLTAGGQFCDRGPQYRTVIFYGSEEERVAAEKSKAAMEKKLGRKIVTDILPAKAFWPAEDYHQDYAKKNPVRYRFYRSRCGRDARVKEVWGNIPPAR